MPAVPVVAERPRLVGRVLGRHAEGPRRAGHAEEPRRGSRSPVPGLAVVPQRVPASSHRQAPVGAHAGDGVDDEVGGSHLAPVAVLLDGGHAPADGGAERRARTRHRGQSAEIVVGGPRPTPGVPVERHRGADPVDGRAVMDGRAGEGRDRLGRARPGALGFSARPRRPARVRRARSGPAGTPAPPRPTASEISSRVLRRRVCQVRRPMSPRCSLGHVSVARRRCRRGRRPYSPSTWRTRDR